MQAQPKHCEVCHIIVAPGDPERREDNGAVYHGSCFRKRTEGKGVIQLSREPQQLTFAFMA